MAEVTRPVSRFWNLYLPGVVLLALFAFSPANAFAACKPVPGSTALFAKPGLNFVMVGEIHGTNEGPEIFKDLVCEAAASKRPVVVALEQEVSSQDVLNKFLASSGDAAAVQQLKASPVWATPFQDGRKSVAQLKLISDLRELMVQGKVARVVAIDPGGGSRDAGMGANLLALQKQMPNALILALAGNLHTAKQPQSAGVQPMASFLPADSTISLLLSAKGGEAWVCNQDGCGNHRLGGMSARERGVYFEAPWLKGYDGILAIGTNATASPPAYLAE